MHMHYWDIIGSGDTSDTFTTGAASDTTGTSTTSDTFVTSITSETSNTCNKWYQLDITLLTGFR